MVYRTAGITDAYKHRRTASARFIKAAFLEGYSFPPENFDKAPPPDLFPIFSRERPGNYGEKQKAQNG
jgi:hypothetical protein